jgi:hypothetical protein
MRGSISMDASFPRAKAARFVPWVAVLAATACEGRLGHRFDEDFTWSFAVPASVHTVRFALHEGPITILPGAPGRVVWRGTSRRAADTEEGLAALQRLELRPQPDESEPGVFALRGSVVPFELNPVAHRFIVKLVVEVPPDVAIEAKTGFGPMSVENRTGAVRLETRDGVLRIDGCAGPVVARSGRGAVIVQKQTGALDIESGDCDTMQVFVDHIAEGGVRLVAKQGGVQAHVPAGVGFVLDAITRKGRAKNGFDIPVEPVGSDGASMRGEVAGGGPLVHVEVDEGNVSVRPENER